MTTPSSVTRRSFLKTSAAAGAGLAALQLPTVRALGANDTIHVGCIGTGGRCRTLMQSLAKVPNVRLAAVCDIYDLHLEMAKQIADPKAFTTKNYHDILARKDIDAVLIGSPDHWHVPMTVDACAAGKDVYVEKPLTHNLKEGQTVIEAQNKHQRIVQAAPNSGACRNSKRPPRSSAPGPWGKSTKFT
jgi:hypothetical protein